MTEKETILDAAYSIAFEDVKKALLYVWKHGETYQKHRARRMYLKLRNIDEPTEKELLDFEREGIETK